MAGQLAAVLGPGRRSTSPSGKTCSMNGRVRESIDKALALAVSRSTTSTPCGRSAPDFFEAVMMPELFLADPVRSAPPAKPLIRLHTAAFGGRLDGRGGRQPRAVGQVPAVLAWRGEAVGVECHVGVELPGPFTQPVCAGACGISRRTCGAYNPSSGAPAHIGAMVAVKDPPQRGQAPVAPSAQPDNHAGEGAVSQMLWYPIRFDETCPLLRRRVRARDRLTRRADARVADGHPVAWTHATAA